MNNIIKKVSIIIGMVFIAWVLIAGFSIGTMFQGFYGLTCFFGVILAFAVSMASLLLWKTDNGRDTTEINAIPLVFTSVYFGASVLANTVFLLLAYLGFPRIIPLVINALMTIVFVSARMFVLPYRDRVSHTTTHTAEKMRSIVGLSARVSEIMGSARDKEVKQRLRKLKEQLDYSTSISQPVTADLEALLFHQLDEISNAIAQSMPAEDVLNKIDAAQMTWSRRNGASSTK